MSVATRRKRERQERRDHILDAARQVFAAKGFLQATMDDIASSADLSKGTLYLYFKGKDELLIALATRTVASVAELYESIAQQKSMNAIEAVKAMLRSYADFIIAHPQEFRIMAVQLASGYCLDFDSPGFAAHEEQVMRIMRAFSNVIERGKRDGSIRMELSSDQVPTQIWGGMIGNLLLRLNGDHLGRRASHKRINYDKLIDGYIDLVCHGLSPNTQPDTYPDSTSNSSP